MELILYRDTYTDKSTVGKLYYSNLMYGEIDEKFVAHTLEDTRRFPGIKVANETCIPAGRYFVGLTESDRFGRVMPIIYNTCKKELKGEGISFTGIRMHGGNTHVNTSGCILVAENRLNDDTIQGTKEAAVTSLIADSIAHGEQVWLQIVDQVAA